MTSGNSKWVRAILTTAVILAITAMMAPAMAQTYIFYSIPPYNASGYVVTLWSNGTVGAPFTPVEVYLGGTYLTTVSLNSTGGLYAQVMLPYGLKAGSYTFSVVNTTAGIVNYSLYPFELKFSISPGFASPGQSLTLNVTGWGFAPGETVKIYLINPVTGATTVIYTTTANSYGFVNVTFSFTAPSSAGEYLIEAVGQTSGVTYLAPFYVTTASVSPQYLAVYNGYSYTLSGSNYPSGTYVDVCFAGTVVNSFKLGTTSFTTTIPIPYNLPQGNYSVVAITTPSPVPSGAPCPGTNETYEGGYATATWTVVPQIVLSTTQTCAAFTVTIYGYGFPPLTGITIYENGTAINQTTTNSNGEFMVSITAPTKYGTYVFTTNYTYTYWYNGTTYPMPATLTVQPPTISISPSEQIVGGLVTISGTCFPPSEPVQVSIGTVNATNLALSGTSWTQVQTYTTPVGPYYTGYVETNSNGGFSGRYVVPLLPPGTYTVNASVSGVPSSNTVSLTIPTPTVTLSVTSVYEGEQVSFTGQNFANFTLGYNMTINLNGYNATCQNNTSVFFGPSDTGALYCEMFRNGTVTGYITMPVVQPGTYTVYFNSTFWSNAYPPGATSGTNDTLYTTASVTMEASYIVVTPSPAPPGAPITVTGYNFYPGTAVTIIVNGTNVTSIKVGPNGEFTAPNVYTVPSYLTSGVLYIVAEENYSTYIAGTPPNAVGNAAATVEIVSLLQVIYEQLTTCCKQVLGNLTSMNATLTAVYNAVQSMSSELSTVYNAVLSVNSTVQSMSSTLSNIQNTLSSMQSTLSTISSDVQLIPALLGQVSTIISDLSSMNATLMNIYDVVSTLNLTVIQNELSTINSNVLSVNSTLTTYAGQVLSNLYNIENTLSTMQSTMSSQYSTIQGELGAIESTLVSMNTTISKISTVPSVVSGSGSYTFTSPGTYTIYQGSGVAQITVTLYYTGYTTMYIYVYPIPGDTSHVVKLQVTSSMGYTITVSGWRVDIYVTSASSYSPVTVYYAYTATS
jgi:conjugal transfer/entry exclusion protein